ncbi:Hsp20/alpha crystallin family protein [Lentibacillus lipolyticus]|nr:Hsp20/alpha crystallin family protein [Lentibacillus lipolyticus]
MNESTNKWEGTIMDKKNNRLERFDMDMSPFRDFMRQMDTFFNESFKQINTLFDSRPFGVNLSENENEVIVTAELPGCKRDQIELETIGNQLRITARNNAVTEVNNDKGDHYQKQQSFQQMERTIALPFQIPEAETKASYHDGQLTVTIPKNNSQKRFIDIDGD